MVPRVVPVVVLVPVFAGSHHGPSFRDCAARGAAASVVAATRLSANAKRFMDPFSYWSGESSLSFFDFPFLGFSFSDFGESSPKMTEPLTGLLRTAVTQSVGAGCWA